MLVLLINSRENKKYAFSVLASGTRIDSQLAITLANCQFGEWRIWLAPYRNWIECCLFGSALGLGC